MNSQDLRKFKISNKPGVYSFIKKEKILYIGKATSLKDRVKSYFGKDLINTRGPAILDMVTQSEKIEWQDTDSVLEALILEANLIKKHQPKYNTKEKDNKSFNYVCITKDSISKVLVIRGRGLNKKEYNKVYGPFPNGSQLREAMKIIRRIFPFVDNDSNKKNNIEFYKQLGLVPNIKIASQKYQNSSRFTPKRAQTTDKNFDISVLQSYKNNIKNIKLFFEGKKKRIIFDLRKEMLSCAKKKEFEKAGEIKNKIFALEHINDVALIKEDIFASHNNLNFSCFTQSSGAYTNKNLNNSVPQIKLNNFRLEAYDIAHMSGKNMVGVMTVIEDGELAKNEYRKFIIRTQEGSNDTGALEEVLSRRLRHTEWGLPNLIVVDGGTAQVNIAKQVLSRYQFDIPVLAVVKNERHKPKAIMGDNELIKKYKREILLGNNEAHRFAITFHKLKRKKSFII
jgi:excinuclease ABC subunit C